MVNEAALLAGRLNKVVVEKIDFIHAVERSIAVSLSLSLSPNIHIPQFALSSSMVFLTLTLSKIYYLGILKKKIYYLGRDNKFTANTTIDSIVNLFSSSVQVDFGYLFCLYLLS